MTPNLLIPNLINDEDYGESRYQNAIKPSSIESTLFFINENLVDEELIELHASNLSESKYFTLLNKIKERESETNLSLNYDKRVALRERNRADTLKLINLRRELSDQELFNSYEEYTDYEEDEGFSLDAEINHSITVLMELLET